MNATEMPKLEPIETVSDTMKHLVTTHYFNQTNNAMTMQQNSFGSKASKLGFQLPKAIVMNYDKQPIDTSMSQTVSSGFFDQIGQAAITKPNMRRT